MNISETCSVPKQFLAHYSIFDVTDQEQFCELIHCNSLRAYTNVTKVAHITFL
jgi:hypothetical protein